MQYKHQPGSDGTATVPPGMRIARKRLGARFAVCIEQLSGCLMGAMISAILRNKTR